MSVVEDRVIAVPARVDDRARGRRLLAPVCTLVGAAAGLTYLGVVDPNEAGHYPLCPLRAVFGIDCPGCGMLRGTHDLVTGNVSGALDHNILLLAVVPLVVFGWAQWFGRSWRGTRPSVTHEQFRRRHALLLGGLVLVLAFGVVRNFVPYLGSGIG